DDPPSLQVAHGVPFYLIVSSASAGRAKVILSAAISSRAMERGLRETDATCGGTMAPSPSPSWLKYELIWRPRLAARLTRVNFESTFSRRSSMGGYIMVTRGAPC